MADDPEHPPVAERESARPVPRSRWWREVLLIAAFYGLYTLVRNSRGTRPVSAFHAFTNAERVIHAERWLGIFRESWVQRWYLDNLGFIQFWNNFYAIAHFVGVAAVLIILFFRFPLRYRLWRNTLAITTFVALIGFSVFPLTPPRLLPSEFGFVDTLRVYGGLWSFQSGPINSVSNQYAAMPSLHTAWALWAALAALEMVRPWWARMLILLFPLATVFGLVVTANHYFLDEIVGMAVLGVSYIAARRATPRLGRHHSRTGWGRGLGGGPSGHDLRTPGPGGGTSAPRRRRRPGAVRPIHLLTVDPRRCVPTGVAAPSRKLRRWIAIPVQPLRPGECAQNRFR